MARTGRPLALLTGALLGLLGCSPEVSTHGYRFDEGTLAQLEPGRTTQDGVAQLLGSPSAVSTFNDRVWYYVSQRSEHTSFYQDEVVEQKVFEMTFDDAGVLRTIEHRTLGDAREVAFVDRETPTSGNELSALQQFIGNIGRFNPEAGQGSR